MYTVEEKRLFSGGVNTLVGQNDASLVGTIFFLLWEGGGIALSVVIPLGMQAVPENLLFACRKYRRRSAPLFSLHTCI